MFSNDYNVLGYGSANQNEKKIQLSMCLETLFFNQTFAFKVEVPPIRFKVAFKRNEEINALLNVIGL